MQLSTSFKSAVEDYLFLMNKGYPQKATLKLVSDKYLLNSIERSMLFRGVISEGDIEERLSKQIKNIPEGCLITVDGFNVMRTIASYLLGRPVYIAMDGFMRDASELHGKPLKQELRIKAFKLMTDILKNGDYSLKIWLDSPVSLSGETAAALNEIMKKEGIQGETLTVHSADKELKMARTGIIATADSAIVENSLVPVIDLAYYTLKKHYSPELLDLREFCKK
jgi:hypothetical protein